MVERERPTLDGQPLAYQEFPELRTEYFYIPQTPTQFTEMFALTTPAGMNISAEEHAEMALTAQHRIVLSRTWRWRSKPQTHEVKIEYKLPHLPVHLELGVKEDPQYRVWVAMYLPGDEEDLAFLHYSRKGTVVSILTGQDADSFDEGELNDYARGAEERYRNNHTEATAEDIENVGLDAVTQYRYGEVLISTMADIVFPDGKINFYADQQSYMNEHIGQTSKLEYDTPIQFEDDRYTIAVDGKTAGIQVTIVRGNGRIITINFPISVEKNIADTLLTRQSHEWAILESVTRFSASRTPLEEN